MRNRISDMTPADKAEFLKQTNEAMLREHDTPWAFIEAKMLEVM